MIGKLKSECIALAKEYNFRYILPSHLLFCLAGHDIGTRHLIVDGYDPELMRATLLREFREYRSKSTPNTSEPMESDMFEHCIEAGEASDLLHKGIGAFDLPDDEQDHMEAMQRMIAAVLGYSGRDRIARIALQESSILDIIGDSGREVYPFDDIIANMSVYTGSPHKGAEKLGDIDFALNDDQFEIKRSKKGEPSPDEILPLPRWGQDRSERKTQHELRAPAGGPTSGPAPSAAGQAVNAPARGQQGEQPPVQEKPSMLQKDQEAMRAAVAEALRHLSQLAASDDLDPVFGRDEEISRMTEVLMRRRKPNIILVAEPGVGKTALVEGLARYLATDPGAEPALADRPIVEVSLTSLLSGTRYRGDFECKMDYLISQSIEQRAILFIDEIHTIMGSGSGSKGGLDGVNILKPVLARDGFSLIGATTPDEMAILREDKALMRRFEVIEISEPDRDQMECIMGRAAGTFLAPHNVSISQAMVGRMLDFADRYLTGRRNPDKSFDILDLAAVSARRRKSSEIELEDLRHATLRLGGSIMMTSCQSWLPEGAEDRLNDAVFGQSDAVRALVEAISLMDKARMSYTPLQLRGGAGTGRAHTARTLARISKARLTTITINPEDPEAIQAGIRRARMAFAFRGKSMICIEGLPDHSMAAIEAEMRDLEAQLRDGRIGSKPLVLIIKGEDCSRSSIGFGRNEEKYYNPGCVIDFMRINKAKFGEAIENALDLIRQESADAGIDYGSDETLKAASLHALDEVSSVSYAHILGIVLEKFFERG